METPMTMFELFLKGGSIMWFILASSLLGTYLVIQKLITLAKRKKVRMILIKEGIVRRYS